VLASKLPKYQNTEVEKWRDRKPLVVGPVPKQRSHTHENFHEKFVSNVLLFQ